MFAISFAFAIIREKSNMASLQFVVALAVLTVVSSTKYQDKGKVNRLI